MLIRQKKESDGGTERKILIGMITSSDFLKNIIPIYRKETSLVLQSSRIVADWCMDYFQQFGAAPRKNIGDIFKTHRDNSRLDEGQLVEIEYLLTVIADEYEEDPNFNVGYSTQKAEEYFRIQSLANVKNELGMAIAGGRPEDGENIIASFQRVVRPETTGINPLMDKDAIIEAFDPESDEFMFQLKHDLGRMLGPFKRGSLSIIVASMGRGKTWFLQEIGLRALYRGFNVLFVSLEMTLSQMMRRIHYSLSALPSEKWAGDMLVPIFDCKKNQIKNACNKTHIRDFLIRQEGEPIPDYEDAPPYYEPCTICRTEEGSRKLFDPTNWWTLKKKEELTSDAAIKRGVELTRRFLGGKQFRLLNPPPNSMNLQGLKVILDNFEYFEGWIPDVIVTDYADKFAPEEKMNDYRHRVYQTILAHKALAMERNCCVVTASQSNTSRKEDSDIKSGDFAEDIRKKAEADMACAFMQTAHEKKCGVMRASMMKERHDDFNTQSQCMVLQNLKIGQPHLDSCYMPYIGGFKK